MRHLIISLIVGDFTIFNEKYRNERTFEHVRCQGDCV